MHQVHIPEFLIISRNPHHRRHQPSLQIISGRSQENRWNGLHAGSNRHNELHVSRNESNARIPVDTYD